MNIIQRPKHTLNDTFKRIETLLESIETTDEVIIESIYKELKDIQLFVKAEKPEGEDDFVHSDPVQIRRD